MRPFGFSTMVDSATLEYKSQFFQHSIKALFKLEDEQAVPNPDEMDDGVQPGF